MSKPTADNAFGRFVASIMTSVVVSSMLVEMAQTGLVSSLLVHAMIFAMTLGTLTMVSDMRYWNLEYAVGYVAAVIVMINSGVLTGLSLLMHLSAIGLWIYLYKI